MGNWFKSLRGIRNGNFDPPATIITIYERSSPSSVAFAGKLSAPPIIPTRVTEYKQCNFAAVGEEETHRRQSQPAAKSAPPQPLGPSSTAPNRRAYLLLASVLPRITRWKRSTGPKNPLPVLKKRIISSYRDSPA
ncbi:hypothetical protein HJG60_010984 [Phyllostomus discolor]|uniref:Uncharacterized protein n=1 Tax=Phyllostomus discolor TaxID=89673 RepID=A0A834EAD9_9CHIR|nr:hypothetical protein HJG60_010984 [Phyllostomus discolor]